MTDGHSICSTFNAHGVYIQTHGLHLKQIALNTSDNQTIRCITAYYPTPFKISFNSNNFSFFQTNFCEILSFRSVA